MQDHLSVFTNDPDFVALFQGQSECISVDEDRVLFLQGEMPEGLHILHEGVVSFSIVFAGNKFVIYRQASSPALLGLPGLLGHEPHAFTAIARKGARLSFVDRLNFTALIASSPLFSLKVLQLFAAEVDSARHALLDQVRKPARRAFKDDELDWGTGPSAAALKD